MTDRIEQQFLLDAAAAIQTLQQLDAGFQTFENRLNSVAQSVQNFNTNIKSGGNGITSFRQQVQATASAINKAQAGQNQLVNSSSNLGTVSRWFQNISDNVGELYNRANKFGLTMETISRVALTQFLVRGWNVARDAIVDATQTAAEFQKQVSLITTISDGAGFDEVAAGVKEISRSFNIPVLETATGVYNALSNQVGTFGETLKFTADAAKFAKSTNSSLADSVDVLSAVINAYGLSAEDTARISSVLFTAIDRGRVVSSELGNSLGRILPSATALGITLEEVSAATALISQKGLNTAETLTRVNALFQTLQKPSKELIQVYKALEVETAELGIRQFGLAGFLQKIIEKGGETSSALAKLAPNIRGMGGILGVTSEGIEAFTKEIELNKKAVADGAIDEAYKKIENDAQFLSRRYNELSLDLQEVGTMFIKTFADAVRASDEFAKNHSLATQAVQAFGTGVGTATLSVIGLQGGIVLLAASLKGLKYLFVANPAVTFAAGIGLATGALAAYISMSREASIQADLKPVLDIQSKSTERLAEITKKSAEDFERSYGRIQAVIAETLTSITPAKQEYTKAIEAIKRANTTLVDSTDLGLDRIIGARRQYVSELGRAAKESDDLVRDSARRVAQLQDSQSDRTFDSKLSGLGDAQQVLKLTQRAAEIARKASADMEAAAKAGNKDGIDLALREFNRAKGFGDEAQQIAKRTNNRALEANTAREINGITNLQIKAEEALTSAQKRRKELAEAERREQELTLKNLERQAKVVLENTGQFDTQGNRFSDKELAQRAQRRDRALSELISAQFKKGDFDLADVLGLAKFTQEFKVDLTKGAEQLKTQLQSNDLGITESINSSLSKFNANEFVNRFRQAVASEGGLITPDELLTPTTLETAASGYADRLKALNKNVRALRNNQPVAEDQLAALRASLDIIDRRAADRPQAGIDFPVEDTTSTDRLGQAFKAAGDQMRAFAEDGRFTEEEIKTLQTSMEDLQKTANDFADAFSVFSQADYGLQFVNDQKAIESALLSIKRLTEAQKLIDEASKAGDLETQVQELETLLEDIQQLTPVQETGEVTSNLQNAVSYATQLRDATALAANAMQSYAVAAATLSGAGTVQNAQFGKAAMHYFNSGGLTRGMDTISAMLAPGESVINSKSTARFFSQIQAMNAGQIPVFRAQQGAVTNVGDINVTVRGGDTSTQTARQIAAELRRELRRGTSRL